MGTRRVLLLLTLTLIPAMSALSVTLVPLVSADVSCSIEPRSTDDLIDIWFDEAGQPASGPSTSLGLIEAADIPAGEPVDEATTAAVTAVAQEWGACTNAGDFPRIYALLTDSYARQQRLAGATADEIRARLEAEPVPLSTDTLWSVGPALEARTLPDGRVGASFVIVGLNQPGIASNAFIAFAQQDGAWRIDDIELLAALAPTAPVWSFEVVAAYPHDAEAYTQGLVVVDGAFYEGTGLNGRSTLRRVDIQTGEVLQSVDLDDDHFGEGIVFLGDRLYQLTWRTGVCFVYDRETFELVETFSYDTEGWGLTTDGEQLIMSDGSSQIVFRDPATFEVTASIDVRDGEAPVSNLNELEYVEGEIWANVYRTDRIARIDPASGQVTGWIDLSGLLDRSDPANQGAEVLNGIAYDPESGRLFVTGKLWPSLFEIELVPPA